jgi:hypothetical protein
MTAYLSYAPRAMLPGQGGQVHFDSDGGPSPGPGPYAHLTRAASPYASLPPMSASASDYNETHLHGNHESLASGAFPSKPAYVSRLTGATSRQRPGRQEARGSRVLNAAASAFLSSPITGSGSRGFVTVGPHSSSVGSARHVAPAGKNGGGSGGGGGDLYAHSLFAGERDADFDAVARRVARARGQVVKRQQEVHLVRAYATPQSLR